MIQILKSLHIAREFEISEHKLERFSYNLKPRLCYLKGKNCLFHFFKLQKPINELLESHSCHLKRYKSDVKAWRNQFPIWFIWIIFELARKYSKSRFKYLKLPFIRKRISQCLQYFYSWKDKCVDWESVGWELNYVAEIFTNI